LSEAVIQTDYEAGLNGTANSLSGTVTIPPDSAGIPSANVTLTTVGGAEINTTQTDSTGHYAFKAVSPGFYNLTATKRGYWPDFNPGKRNSRRPKNRGHIALPKRRLEHK